MKAAFYTLGCKVNQNETGALEQIFQNAGYTIVQASEEADVYVVNSCTVTAGGDAKSRQWLRRARRQSPCAITVLTGCFPQAFPKEALLPEADIVTGTAARARILKNVEQFKITGERIVDIEAHKANEIFEELPIDRMPLRTRAFVKIEDGCNRRCAYCIIPKARGPVRSRNELHILNELKVLAAHGHKEVVFTGINLPSYGKDGNTCLADIVEKASTIKGIERIRLSSLDPDLITDEQIARFAAVNKFCPQFHLSLQSGCDATLRRMRRPYTLDEYRASANKLLIAMPNASFSTDVIVGFPGETDEEFEDSLAFILSMQFLKVHVFPYSSRPGTPAAEFANQIPQHIKNLRVARLQKASDEIRHNIMRKSIGQTHSVLLESPLANGLFNGYTKNYIPVELSVPNGKSGQIVQVRLCSVNADRCTAEFLPASPK